MNDSAIHPNCDSVANLFNEMIFFFKRIIII